MVNILAFGAHPDDCEIFMGGTLLVMKYLGYHVGICDLSLGEAGTYGSSETRLKELEKASACLSLDNRITLDLPDGNIRNGEENRLKIIDVIREQTPDVVFSFHDEPGRHPDHHHCGAMVKECCYLAGLEKIMTRFPAYRPSSFVSFPELIYSGKPDFVVDVTDVWEKKLDAIRCYGSQVTLPGDDDSKTKTFIRSNRFWDILEARACMAGAMIGVNYGEPFFSDRPPRLEDPLKAFLREFG